MSSLAPFRARWAWFIVGVVVAIALASYVGANWALIRADATKVSDWYPRSFTDLRAQLGQFGDFINPFLTLVTVLFVLATYRHQLLVARRHDESQALSRYEDAVRSVQFIPNQSPDEIWTGREAFFRFFADAVPNLKTVRQLADSPPVDRHLSSLVNELTEGAPLKANFDDYGHCFQHAYLAMLEVIGLSDESVHLPLSDIEFLFYLPFITRLRNSPRDQRDQRALEMIVRMLEQRGYRLFCARFLPRGA